MIISHQASLPPIIIVVRVTRWPVTRARMLHMKAGEPKKLVLYPGDNHGIDHHAADMLDTLYRWSLELLTGSGTAADHS